MRRAIEPSGELDPPTEAMGPCEGVTTAGGQATLSLQHLHSLLTTLAPLRAAYASAAFDRLRGLPTESRRALLPHVLHEHPDLVNEPRVRVLARDLGIDLDLPDIGGWLAGLSGVQSRDGGEALARLERALIFAAETLAAIARERPAIDGIPETPIEMLAWMLETQEKGLREATHRWSGAGREIEATLDAACELARERDERDDLRAIEQRAGASRWWPRVLREAACWAQLKKERAERRSFDDALATRLRDGS